MSVNRRLADSHAVIYDKIAIFVKLKDTGAVIL